jgi:hypothetical protein
MGHDLEFPGTADQADWDSLYRSRGAEVVAHRPFFTGDVFTKTTVRGADEPRTRSIALLQHPCALRVNGVDLTNRLIVAEVKPFQILTAPAWRGHFSRMPLPDLIRTVAEKKRHHAIFFESVYVVASADLAPERRIACLSPVGVNILLQRWVSHNSRVIVPAATYQEVTGGPYEEADIVEDWCETRIQQGTTAELATHEAARWLREKPGHAGARRQDQLRNPQMLSGIRKEMRTILKARSSYSRDDGGSTRDG